MPKPRKHGSFNSKHKATVRGYVGKPDHNFAKHFWNPPRSGLSLRHFFDAFQEQMSQIADSKQLQNLRWLDSQEPSFAGVMLFIEDRGDTLVEQLY